METKDEKFNVIIGKIRSKQPVLQDANLLTERIMQQIELKSDQSASHLIVWFRAITSSAAALLLGLFIFQQTEINDKIASNSETPVLENTISIDSTCIQALNEEQVNLMKMYYCYMQQNAIKNNRFRSFIKQSIQLDHESFN